MNAGQTVFSQLLDHLPSYEFQKCVERYRGDAHHRGFSCRDHYLAMAFAQLTRAAQENIDLPTLAALLGHASIRMVQKYVHPTADLKKAAMARYDQAIMTTEAKENSRRVSLDTRKPTAGAQALQEQADSKMLGL